MDGGRDLTPSSGAFLFWCASTATAPITNLPWTDHHAAAVAIDDFEHYYVTLAHECAYATGHGSRSDRNLKGRFGDQGYAAEELIAEMTAAMVGADLGLPTRHLDHHASYIASWLKIMGKDDRAILTAAAKSEAASDWLLERGRTNLADTLVSKKAA